MALYVVKLIMGVEQYISNMSYVVFRISDRIHVGGCCTCTDIRTGCENAGEGTSPLRSVRGAMNCATTNAFFVNEKLLFRNGIRMRARGPRPTECKRRNELHIHLLFQL